MKIPLVVSLALTTALAGCDSRSSPAPTGSTTTTTAEPSTTTTVRQPDNSAVNKRDRDDATLTPGDQATGTEADRNITAEVRRSITSESGMSINARNVKIVTLAGVVTLRGPVNSQAEKDAIEAKAKAVAGVTRVDNQLEVKNN
jgi:hyperosmotically inducible periplasmic protein